MWRDLENDRAYNVVTTKPRAPGPTAVVKECFAVEADAVDRLDSRYCVSGAMSAFRISCDPHKGPT
ncbi:hypothetical protein B5P45_03400 [Phyllobacterium zundukense]|uniref:Uncharacterized protein n=1 Tax=Phyllobacterium zundukense TaxID=1867719 RepID=A0A2N9W354_9HYPH|nr:hypothetical protein BLM14_21790 [Phyllobacterium zundukense]PIO46172.1 hypothetical protein B5P45_03400 [Phyllobacterium zundukense]